MSLDYSNFGCSENSSAQGQPCVAANAMESVPMKWAPKETLLSAIQAHQQSVSQITDINDPTFASAIQREATGPSMNYSSFQSTGSGVMGFEDCGCNGDYVNVGCGCDCHPRGYNWNYPTSGCMKNNMVLILLILVLIGFLVYYFMNKRRD